MPIRIRSAINLEMYEDGSVGPQSAALLEKVAEALGPGREQR
jgi:hypothetical protein